jgi:YHS domain-containing protein
MTPLLKRVFIAIALFVAALGTVSAQTVDFNKDSDGLWVDGYDAVAYLTTNKAVKGSKTYQALYQGTRFQFSSEQNKQLFLAMPEKYIPAYGGWCAYAMGANGEKVEVNPKTFKVIGGKTYLFYNKFFTNTLDDWNKDEANLKAKADANWRTKYHNGQLVKK